MKVRNLLVVIAALLFAHTVSAQMFGTYTLNPNGSGARNYKSFAAASFDLFNRGVNGPVVFDIASGSYTESWALFPVLGSSATNTITFKSATRRGATFSTKATAVVFYSLLSVRPEWVVFDGIVFASTNGTRAISLFGHNVVIRDCVFAGTTISISGNFIEVHHCSFTGGLTPIDFKGVGGSFHHNEINLTNAKGRYAIFTATRSLDRYRIYNNVFTGTLSTSNGDGMVLSGPIDFVHNTVALRLANSTGSGAMIEVYSSFAMVPTVTNNIFANFNGGFVMTVNGSTSPFYIRLQHNHYWTTRSTNLFRGSAGSYTTFAAWQTATGQDSKSSYVDPQFVNTASSPNGLKPKPGAPSVAKAVGTPAYVKDDFSGLARAKPATIGAHRGYPKSTFVTFGQGCPGKSNFVPVLGHSGTVAMGSTNFAVTLSNARGDGAVSAWLIIGGTRQKVAIGGTCNLLVSLNVLFLTGVSGTKPGNGTATIPMNLPNNPRLRGLSGHFQWAVVDSGAVGSGLAMSNGGTLTL